MYAHVFGEFGEYCTVCEPISGPVVSLEGWPWLGPAHLNEILKEGDHLLDGDEDVHKILFKCG